MRCAARPLLPLLVPLALAGCAQVEQALPGVAYHTTFEGHFVDQLEPPGATATAAADAGGKALSGDGAKLSLLNSEGLVHAPAFESYLESVMAGALAAYPYPTQPMTIRIEASENAAAWATPDNQVFVTLGLLEGLESEGELATVLAHEAGHVQLRHFDRQDYFDGQREAVTAGASLAMTGLAVADLRARKTAGGGVRVYREDPRGTAEKTVQAAAIMSLVNGVSDQVVNSHWTRRQEQQADLFAADLIIAAGYNPRAPADLFQLLAQLWGQERDFKAFLEAEERRLVQEVAALDDPAAALETAPAKLFEVGSRAGGEVWRRFGLTHLKPEERQAAMLEYVGREYKGQRAKAAQREAEAQRYQAALRERLPEAVRAGHRAARQAMRLLAEGKIAGAEQQALIGISGPTAGAAHTRVVMAMVRTAQRRHDEALANLERIDKGDFRPRKAFDLLATEYLRRQRYGEALAALDAGAAQFGTAEPFLPLRIEVQLAMDDVEGAWQTHALCRQAASSTTREACDVAIGRAPKVAGADSPGLDEAIEKVKGLIGSFLPAGGKP